MKFLGPGFILSASIVGSGELIATTVLGAKAGFVALWIIIISCLAKVAVQLEFGKHAILTGETVMTAFNKLPGPRFGNARWPVWIVFLVTVLKIVQLGGMMGGAVVILQLLFPVIPIPVWTFFTTVFVALLIYNGKYVIVEKGSLVMIAAFTVLTLTSLVSLHFTPFAFELNDVLSGLQFKLSPDLIIIAIGAFGITGVASDEIIAYNYWCLEKGYAAYTGPRKDSIQWRQRAEGWIKVMYVDAITAMIVYTIVTVAFFLLGSAILHGRADVPEGNEVINTLALIYTETLGPGIKTAYLVGGFFVLFSSLYATLAAWTRLYADIFGQMKWIDFWNLKQRRAVVALLSWIFPFCWAAAYLFIELPVAMVLFGGLVGSFLLLIVVFAALHFKYTRTNDVKAGIVYNIAFWFSVVSIGFVGVYGVIKLL
jgi:Mn2+/Fe2+ NRAMP family transporter